MSTQKIICASTIVMLGLTSAWEVQAVDSCPNLTTSNLAAAVCSTPENPFSPNVLSKVKFHATTPCLKRTGISKTLQVLVKGEKEYPATFVKSTPGAFSCTYKIAGTPWQQALNTSHEELVLTAPVLTRQSADFLGGLGGVSCPDLVTGDLDTLKDGQLSIERKTDPKLVYTFRVGDLKGGSVFEGIKGIFGSAPDLPKLKGTLTLTKAYEMTCSYTHHTGGEERPLTLEGSNLMKGH